MRCTRCDGLAVPQAVGIDPQGKVIFGWCLQCLADRNCTLVETAPSGPWRFSRTALGVPEPVFRPRGTASVGPISEGDTARWIVGIVSFLIVSWGLILLAAGLWPLREPPSATSRLGNGSSALLMSGGSATALLGVGLVVLAARRHWYPGTFLLAPLSGFCFLLGMAILVHGIIAHQPRRNVPVVVGSLVCLSLSALTWRIRQSQRRRMPAALPPPARKTGPGVFKNRAADRRPL